MKWTHSVDGEKINSRQTSFLDGNSNLVIRAIGPAGGNPPQTALINTANVVNFEYLDTPSDPPVEGFFFGKGTTVEARIAVEQVEGVIHAFWCLGTNSTSWPDMGEVDILEVFGNPTFWPTTTVHNSSGTEHDYATMFPSAWDDIGAGFHRYRMVWTDTGDFEFYLDWVPGATPYHVVPYDSLSDWPFPIDDSNPMYLILNMSIGSEGGGDYSATPWPVDMTVDWIRVWRNN